ncbi:nucleoside-diphosphate-sugar epimerase [Neolewinella xylanilytica]|uniref:Nucleoside-diphosphate-sugar epimerase n=1 Tax=Neolewinella xylanilytica TaxID=1514080 RepID=A0A2S6I7I0_9BACT|nr:NAD-dependent epimerase/dehydratase family protein [Neolewinella xylanilytica]PPK87461.1 nucleoside-diphosphate-sugar epimerase [Neolewinella xylanilytica]
MHTILGAGGPIANELTRHLTTDSVPVRLVSRSKLSPQMPTVHWKGADLLDHKAVVEVTRGSEVIYLTAGLKYDARIWAEQWPVIMDNVIAAARTHGSRLLFFDNVYMYGLLDQPVTEESAYRPVSKKGEVRARIADTLMKAVRAGEVNATIARAPDFYGAASKNSFLDSMVIDRIAAGQNPMWIGDKNKVHNFIFVPDAGRAMYLLGQHPEHDNQIWHLPTPAPITGQRMLDLVGEVFNRKPWTVPIKKGALRLLGLFDPVVADSVEMYYQYDRDYRFDSSKFQAAFGMQPITYRAGLEQLRDHSAAIDPTGKALSIVG